ncbi:hypothetical protein NMY22_g11457 [Coprinellus aureogranulatus]|nr:hypothetical protein NMY22_g11457 [Coprinellus aureogranulatus]
MAGEELSEFWKAAFVCQRLLTPKSGNSRETRHVTQSRGVTSRDIRRHAQWSVDSDPGLHFILILEPHRCLCLTTLVREEIQVMAFSIPTGSPFATPSHHYNNPSAGNTPFISNPFPSSSPHHGSNSPFGHPQNPTQAWPGSGTVFATPLQPNRTSNVPAFKFPGQDPFSVPAGGSSSNATPGPGGTPFQPKSPFALPNSSPPESAAKQTMQPPAQKPATRGSRYRSYNNRSKNENAYQPINSSPLAQPPPRLLDRDEDDMDDDDDADDTTFSNTNIPSSPLGRFPNSSSTVTAGSASSSSSYAGSHFNIGGSAPQRRRRPKAPGEDEDDEGDDDAVNPSPLFARRRAQYKSRRSLPHPSTTSASSSSSSRRTSLSLSHRTPSLASIPSPTSSPPIASLFQAKGRRGAETEENPRTTFLKDQFKKRYFACAVKAREKAVRERRKRVEGMEGLLDPSPHPPNSLSGRGGRGGNGARGRGRGEGKGKGKKRCSDDEMGEDEDEEEEEGDDDDGLNDPVRFPPAFLLFSLSLPPSLPPSLRCLSTNALELNQLTNP